ncbi:hypothetical protein C3489_05970 [Streptomyces sp. Ru71]|uniref:hypothetical protein n=1 Tax=Streptomyces sp. Ru71 TaxID=2080746 RepID=UPI000CDE277A|nr:hypothetical protein [Streptomyces sp. Ru71]POX56265.1 hypothetical protein C3489_05970 [Streptomyces sp. Ru71]
MDSGRPPTPSRRTLLRGAALSALTTAAFLNAAGPRPAQAAVPARPKPPEPAGTSHRSYRAIVGVL